MNSDPVTIPLEYRYETARSYLVHVGVQDVWLPKSQVTTQDKKTFTMPEWFAKKNGLR